MASLRDSVKDYQEELRDGIAWVAFWKEGRSWNAELFHLEVDGTLEPFDRSRLEEIKAADPTAVILNGYYCGHLGENMSLDELTAGVRYHYENSMNDLDGFIGAHDDRLPPEVIEEARAAAHAAGLPFSEKPYRDGEDFDPYIFDGSMSIEDYELMHRMIEKERSEQMDEWKTGYSSYDRDRLDAADKMKIERGIYFETKDADISPLTALPLAELMKLREESAAAEQTVFENLKVQASAWEEQAGKTLLFDKAIEYARIPEVKHTANKWQDEDNDRHTISNRVYKMSYHVYENTRYDKAAQKSIPYSYTLSWNVYTNSPHGYGQAKIAGQDRKVFADRAAMEKYLNGRMPHIRFHDLRHTAATNMHQLTGDFYTVGEVLGHTLAGIGVSLGLSMNFEAVTARYVDVRLERKKEVLDAYHGAVKQADPAKAEKAEPKKAKSAAKKKSSDLEL